MSSEPKQHCLLDQWKIKSLLSFRKNLVLIRLRWVLTMWARRIRVEGREASSSATVRLDQLRQ